MQPILQVTASLVVNPQTGELGVQIRWQGQCNQTTINAISGTIHDLLLDEWKNAQQKGPQLVAAPPGAADAIPSLRNKLADKH